MDIRLKELLHNLKDRDWDVNPVYKMDENEADKIIKQLERLDDYSNWNLTKNKLPKDEEYVLCVLETGKQAVMMIVKDEEGICFWSEDFPQDSYSTDQVIFWKPLDRVCGVDTYSTKEFEKLRKRLDQMSSSDFLNKWIPVSERLPEWGEEVLTINNDGNYEINHIIDDERNEWFNDDDIVAWMPLPKPYKAESEG